MITIVRSGGFCVFLGLAGLVSMPTASVAQGAAQGRRAEELADRFADRVAEALHLDDARSSRLRDELHISLENRRALGGQRRALMRELGAVVRDEPVDQTRVAELLDAILRTQVREAQINLEEQSRLAAFMTPIERARLLYLRQRFYQQARQRQPTDRRNEIRGDRRPPPAAERRVVPDPGATPPSRR